MPHRRTTNSPALRAPPADFDALLRVFDRSPRALKVALWDSPLNVAEDHVPSPAELPAVLAALRALEAAELVRAWGPDHPQAGRPLAPLVPRRRGLRA